MIKHAYERKITITLTADTPEELDRMFKQAAQMISQGKKEGGREGPSSNVQFLVDTVFNEGIRDIKQELTVILHRDPSHEEIQFAEVQMPRYHMNQSVIVATSTGTGITDGKIIGLTLGKTADALYWSYNVTDEIQPEWVHEAELEAVSNPTSALS